MNVQKETLIKDLSARIPYGVIAEVSNVIEGESKVFVEEKELTYADIASFSEGGVVCGIKPYLRPLSDMTKEEKEELRGICDFRTASDDYDCFDRQGIQIIQEINNKAGNHQNLSIDFSDYEDLIDWLNSHHFDYRGLIEMELALKAPERMY